MHHVVGLLVRLTATEEQVQEDLSTIPAIVALHQHNEYFVVPCMLKWCVGGEPPPSQGVEPMGGILWRAKGH